MQEIVANLLVLYELDVNLAYAEAAKLTSKQISQLFAFIAKCETTSLYQINILYTLLNA